MSTPFEKYRAVAMAREFMRDLMNKSITPGVPKHLRDRSYGILIHFPSDADLQAIADKVPDVVTPNRVTT